MASEKLNIVADLHTHTVASTHAYSTLLENITYAKKRGLSAIAITDHTNLMPDAPHIWHIHNFKCLPRELDGVTIIRGAEVNVTDYEGGLDVTEKELNRLEWVIASFHGQVLTPTNYDEITAGYINLAKNQPLVDVIGHCTTDKFYFDYEKGIKAFKEYNKIVEINECSILYKKGSRKNAAEVLRLCKKYEVPVVFSTDAHFCTIVGNCENALAIAESVDFPRRLVFNSDMDRIREYITAKRGDVFGAEFEYIPD